MTIWAMLFEWVIAKTVCVLLALFLLI